MFTGIIEDLASVASVSPLEQGCRLEITTALPTAELVMGESITLNGACMTVVVIGDTGFSVDVSSESLRCTTLGDLGEGAPVNLERSLRMGDRLGGHVVTGHVDGVGRVRTVREEGESSVYTFETSPELLARLVEKGSVAVDGVSLTCYALTDDSFDVALIPHTMTVTTLGQRAAGDAVNLELDV
ncbi:MAG: riboflavin synthase, partial [bacterium]